jgi:hypothetical protein
LRLLLLLLLWLLLRLLRLRGSMLPEHLLHELLTVLLLLLLRLLHLVLLLSSVISGFQAALLACSPWLQLLLLLRHAVKTRCWKRRRQQRIQCC